MEVSMLKRLLTFQLVFSLLMMSAHGSTNFGLKEAFDEFHYAISVEWDQKDQIFYKAQVKKLEEDITELMENGLTENEISYFFNDLIKDPTLQKEMVRVTSQISSNKLSYDESIELARTIGNSYMKGSSWNGYIAPIFAMGMMVTLISIFVIIPIVKCTKQGTCDKTPY